MSFISRLTIDQQFADIGINVTNAQLQITNPHNTFQIKQESPEMTIEQEKAKFKVNWKQVRSQSGLKPPSDLKQSLKQKASGEVSKGVSQTVAEGNTLAKVENPGNRVAQISKSKSLETAQREINIGTMPQDLPEIEWDPGYIKINWSNHKQELEWDGDYMPEVVVDPPYSVEIYLLNKPYLKIIVENDAQAPSEYGQNVDTRL